MLAELLLERRRPGHELEAEAVVDHREATGREGETLAIHACDMLACGRLQIRQARVGREPRRGGIQPATAQATQEIARQDDAPARKSVREGTSVTVSVKLGGRW